MERQQRKKERERERLNSDFISICVYISLSVNLRSKCDLYCEAVRRIAKKNNTQMLIAFVGCLHVFVSLICTFKCV